MKQHNQLALERCPQCNVAKPTLGREWGPFESRDYTNALQHVWSVYRCSSCGRMVLVSSPDNVGAEISNIWPETQTVAEAVPARASEFLTQAIASLCAPAGAVMLTASAVDAMLKDKGYKDGSLYSRIQEAAAAHLITAEIAMWADEIRLDANDQRHADETAQLPSQADAQKSIEFAKALAQFLYVLPAYVERGRTS